MNNEKDILNHFKKSKKPSIPDGFFDGFYLSLKDEIESLNPFTEVKLVKRKKENIQSSISSSFDINLNEKIQDTSIEKRKIFYARFVYPILSAAAILAVLLLTYRANYFNEISVVETNPIDNSEMLDNYLAYLDEELLIDYIIDNDVQIETNDNDVYDPVESDIEAIYLDL